MGSALDVIVPVSIQYGSVSPTGTAFGIPMIASQFLTSKTTTAFTRIRKYFDLANMLADGWAKTDKEYLAAKAMLSQIRAVPYFFIGRRDSGDTAWADALDAIQAENSGWYGFTFIPNGSTTANIITEQLQVAAWTEGQMHILLTQTADATVLTSGVTNDAASQISALTRNRTGIIYHGTAGEYADAAWLGLMLQKDPGSASFAYKDISNGNKAAVTLDSLIPSAKQIAWNKFANTFTAVAGVSVTEQGKVAGGDFGYLDITVGVDCVQANIQTEIFKALAENDKLPYTDDGIAAIVGIVKSVLLNAAARGIVVASTIVVTAPKYADISTANKAARNVPDVKFSAVLQGAINTVHVYGTVSQ